MMCLVADAPFADVVNPTAPEITAWAYSDDPEPMEDFQIIVADPEFAVTLVGLVNDKNCPKRQYLLGSLYCLVGHTPHGDERLHEAVLVAENSDDPWVATWARRSRHVINHSEDFSRDDWCGWNGLRTTPAPPPKEGSDPLVRPPTS